MPRNPSELQRLEEELKDAYAQAKDLRFPKDYRESCIRDARKLERQLGLEPKELVKVKR